MVIYNADHYLKKFRHKPERLWCTKQFRLGDRFCVLGHCGATDHETVPPQEAVSLEALFGRYILLPAHRVNDYSYSAERAGVATHTAAIGPRARIMVALRIIKARGG